MKRTLLRGLAALTLLFGALAPTTVALAASATAAVLPTNQLMLATATVDDGVTAPDVPAVPEPSTWFTSAAALAVVIAAIVAVLKAHFLKTLDGLGTVLASLVVGVLLGLLGHALGYLTDGVISAIGFGGSAGLLASGGWDVLKGLLGKSRAAT